MSSYACPTCEGSPVLDDDGAGFRLTCLECHSEYLWCQSCTEKNLDPKSVVLEEEDDGLFCAGCDAHFCANCCRDYGEIVVDDYYCDSCEAPDESE